MGLARRKVRLPRTQRGFFDLLSYLTPEGGLPAFLDMIDYSGVTPADILLTVLDRAPGEPSAALPPPVFDAKQRLSMTLLSVEFRQSIMSRLLRAYPEKGRDIFIHVPKCAGTDLIMNLGSRGLPLPRLLEVGGWLSTDDFFQTVAGFVRQLPDHDRIFVYGHMELGGYVYDAGIRSQDRIFTVIREPLDLMLSQANYAIGRLRQDPTGTAPDTAEILSRLGIPRLPEDVGDRELKDLATRALLHPEISQPNRACTYLGRGMEGTYKAAMDRLVVHNVEITTMAHYERWLSERWGVGSSKRHNRSDVILTRNEVRWLYADTLAPAMVEDRKLFDTVSWALTQTGGASITGLEIGRLAGAWLLEGVPDSLVGAGLREPKLETARNLLVAEEAQAVHMHLQAARATGAGSPAIHTILTIEFGERGTGTDYQLDGWSVTEKTFTWTNAPESRLQLPPFPPSGICILQLIGNPYVSAGKLPVQRIEVSVNDEPLGVATIKDIGIIECDVPRHLLRDGKPVTVTLRLPTAARPKDVSGMNDDRLLAFALHRVRVLVVQAAESGPA